MTSNPVYVIAKQLRAADPNLSLEESERIAAAALEAALMYLGRSETP